MSTVPSESATITTNSGHGHNDNNEQKMSTVDSLEFVGTDPKNSELNKSLASISGKPMKPDELMGKISEASKAGHGEVADLAENQKSLEVRIDGLNKMVAALIAESEMAANNASDDLINFQNDFNNIPTPSVKISSARPASKDGFYLGA